MVALGSTGERSCRGGEAVGGGRSCVGREKLWEGEKLCVGVEGVVVRSCVPSPKEGLV